MFNCQLKADNIPAKGQEMVSRRRVLSAIPAKPLFLLSGFFPSFRVQQFVNGDGGTIPVAGFLNLQMREKEGSLPIGGRVGRDGGKWDRVFVFENVILVFLLSQSPDEIGREKV